MRLPGWNRVSKLRSIIGPALGTVVALYFGVHAVHGDRGLLAWHKLSAELAEAEALAVKVRAERARWEHRVGHLSVHGDGLDLDLLDERARRMLNLGHSQDVIIFDRR